jgi:transcriptional regulator with XRE-family HTH domain
MNPTNIEYLNQIILESGYKKERIAEMIGVSKYRLSRWLNNKHKMPKEFYKKTINILVDSN